MNAHGNEADAAALLQHAAWLRRLAAALVGESNADDLTQETWLAALSHRVDASRPLRPWLRKVATNFARRRGRDRIASEPAEESPDSHSEDPFEVSAKIDSEAKLTESLRRLDEPFRSTLYLRFYEELSPKAIAQKTGVPPGTVRWRLKRGLELLRERLDADVAGGREAWMAMLAPLAALELKTAASASTVGLTATSGSSLFGIFAMSALWKLVVVIGASLAIYFAVLASEDPNSDVAAVDSVSLEAPAELEGAEDQQDLGAKIDLVESESGNRTPEGPSAAAASTTEEPTIPTTVVVTGRVTDPFGGPLAEVKVARTYGGLETKTNWNGRFELTLSAPQHANTTTWFRFEKHGRATIQRREALFGLETYDLGEVRLEPGGIVTGRVLDETGAPLKAASVAWKEEASATRTGTQRFTGASSVPSTRTDEDGNFTLEGVPVGALRIWSSLKGYESHYSDPVEVRASQTERTTITLPLLKDENRIRIQVVDEAGESIANAKIRYRQSSKLAHGSSTGSTQTNSAGFYEYAGQKDSILSVVVNDPKGELTTATLDDLTTGPELHTVVLREPRLASLRVRSSDGSVIEGFRFELLASQSSRLLERQDVEEGNEGTFSIPASQFDLRVLAPFTKATTLEGLLPDEVEELEVTLDPVPGLRGVVLADDQPIAGASVTLHRVAKRNIEYTVNNYRSRYRHDALDTMLTAEDGEFRLTVGESGEYVVRVEAPGYAPQDSADLTIGGDLEHARVELRLARGGTLEGVVRSSAGADIRNVIVGISRGDIAPQTTRVDQDGRFVFRNLTPGEWQAVIADTLLLPDQHSTGTRSGSGMRKFADLVFPYEVFDERATFVRLELEPTDAWVLNGKLSNASAGELTWKAQLMAPDSLPFGLAETTSTEVRSDGSFEIASEDPKRFQLALLARSTTDAWYFLTDQVDLATESTWEIAYDSGTLRFEGLPEWSRLQDPPIALLFELNATANLLVAFGGDKNGEALIEHLPAGVGALVRPNLLEPDPRKWERLETMRVLAGTTRTEKL